MMICSQQGQYNLNNLPDHPYMCSGGDIFLPCLPTHSQQMGYSIYNSHLHWYNEAVKIVKQFDAIYVESTSVLSVFNQEHELQICDDGTCSMKIIQRKSSIFGHALYSADVLVVLDTLKVCDSLKLCYRY
jgi:hypothetical protein